MTRLSEQLVLQGTWLGDTLRLHDAPRGAELRFVRRSAHGGARN